MSTTSKKWYISRHAGDDEILKTCWLAVEVALRHEAMEQFTFHGKRPFNPHADVYDLLHVRTVTRKPHPDDIST